MGEMDQIEGSRAADAAASALDTMVVHLQHLLGDAMGDAEISGGQIILRTTQIRRWSIFDQPARRRGGIVQPAL